MNNLNDNAKKIINKKLEELRKSKFRSSFHLRKKERTYLETKGFSTIKKHAYDFINKNLSPAYIPNDGAQTPYHNHPVFIARHATATCCRSCLEKWHHIPQNIELTQNQINYIVELIMEWIKREYKESK